MTDQIEWNTQYVSVIAAGVLGAIAVTTASAGAFIGIIFATILTCYGLNFWNLESSGIEINGGSLFLGMLASPLFPLVDAFTRVSKIESRAKQQKNRIENELPGVVDFFANKDHTAILEELNNQVKRIDSRIAKTESDITNENENRENFMFPEVKRGYEEAKGKLTEKKEAYSAVIKNLTDSIAYFSKLK